MRTSFGQSEITLFVTTEQDESTFTIETRFYGLLGLGFIETQPGSGLYSFTGTAQRGKFTVIQLQAGPNGQPDLSVQSDGNGDERLDRQKGLILTADNPTDELTVYALSSDISMNSADAFMAINCVEFPASRYFVFSSSIADGDSQVLITPCQDATIIDVIKVQQHPSWVIPSLTDTSRIEIWTTLQSL